MAFSRRTFLTRAALAGGALVLPSGAMFSSGCTLSGCAPSGCAPSDMARRTPHYFVFYFMMGGWDVMLTTDPVPHKEGLWVPYDEDAVVEVGPYKFGPHMKPLLPYIHKTALLRGIYCDALNHPQARIRMCTGVFKSPGTGGRPGIPSVQALIAEKYGIDYEIPNLSADSLRPSTFRGDSQKEVLEPVRVASIDQLRSLVQWRPEMAKHRREILEALEQQNALVTKRYGAATALPKEFETYAELAHEALDSDYAERVKGTGSFSTDKVMTNQMKSARLAVEAIRNDLAPVITVGSGEFDSHTKSQYAGHSSAVLRGMKTVADICDGLESTPMPGGKTLLDHTTVVVTSEFSRDPVKNELGGKHHWPANSIIMIGKGTPRRKNNLPTVFGECDDGLNPVKVNPRNGSTKRNAEDLEMNHGIATILAMAGLDPVKLIGQEPVPALLGST